MTFTEYDNRYPVHHNNQKYHYDEGEDASHGVDAETPAVIIAAAAGIGISDSAHGDSPVL